MEPNETQVKVFSRSFFTVSTYALALLVLMLPVLINLSIQGSHHVSERLISTLGSTTQAVLAYEVRETQNKQI